MLKPVVEPLLVCLMHREVKQTVTSEFGAEKDSFQGQARRTGGSCSKPHNSSMGKKFLISKIWGEGFRECDFVLIGWW